MSESSKFALWPGSSNKCSRNQISGGKQCAGLHHYMHRGAAQVRQVATGGLRSSVIMTGA